MKRQSIILVIAFLLICVGLSGCEVISNGDGGSESSIRPFFNLYGNLSNSYTNNPRIYVDFVVTTVPPNNWSFSTIENNGTILINTMTTDNFNYSIKSGFAKYLVNVSWYHLDGGKGEKSSLFFKNIEYEDIKLEIEIRKDKKVKISLISPKTLIVYNNQPTVSIIKNVTNNNIPLIVQFYGIGNDSDGFIESYYWDFDDGKTTNEQNPTHTFETYGKYIVQLTVTDDQGKTNTDIVTIKVKIPVVTEQDYQLIEWIGKCNDNLSYYSSRITSSLNIMHISGLEYWGDKCWDAAYDYSNEIDQFTDLSSPFNEIKQIYQLALNDYKSLGINSKIAAETTSDGIFELAIESIGEDFQSITAHLLKLTNMIELIER